MRLVQAQRKKDVHYFIIVHINTSKHQTKPFMNELSVTLSAADENNLFFKIDLITAINKGHKRL